ncbi:MAG: archaellin/type IV pilin N-terminal domain-containing protein [Candidatus Nanohaloarchaea archaeon]
MTRKGITPVVAIVLLLMMTVAAAGGAYTWVTGIIERGQEQGQASLNRQVDIKDLTCWTNGTVDFYLVNSGQTELDANDVTAYLYSVGTDNLLNTNGSLSNGQWSVGSAWDSSTDFASTLTAGNQYEVEFELTNEDGYSVTGSCQAE